LTKDFVINFEFEHLVDYQPGRLFFKAFLITNNSLILFIIFDVDTKGDIHHIVKKHTKTKKIES